MLASNAALLSSFSETFFWAGNPPLQKRQNAFSDSHPFRKGKKPTQKKGGGSSPPAHSQFRHASSPHLPNKNPSCLMRPLLQFPVRLIRGRYLDFSLCTIPTVCRYEKYGVFRKLRRYRAPPDPMPPLDKSPSHLGGRQRNSRATQICPSSTLPAKRFARFPSLSMK